MDDLLREFLTETGESLDTVDVELVRFEQDPNNAKILGNIFRLVHTIKGTCGFLGLPRLEALAHAGRDRDGQVPRRHCRSPARPSRSILATIDRIKEILAELERPSSRAGRRRRRPDRRSSNAMAGRQAAPRRIARPAAAAPLVYQVLERPLRPGEVSLDELERAFRETPGPDVERRAALPTGRRRKPTPRPARRRRQSAASARERRPSASTSTRSST